jgi:hypothetical protein
MNRLMLRILREMYPDEFPAGPISPEHSQRGRDLAKYRPWAKGRIGGLERRVHSALIYAEIQKMPVVTTGWVAKAAYLGVGGRSGGDKLARWMYDSTKRALQTYADPIGRGNGHGSPILWKLKEGDAVYASVIRKKKALMYARRKRGRL